jgi:hypothetical protein
MSAVALIIGVVFVGIGVFVFIPITRVFGGFVTFFAVLWTLVALAIAIYHAVNLFSERGVAQEVVDFDTSTQPGPRSSASESPEQRLARLDGLKTKGLVSDKEYEEQRKRILDEI